jgi:hypothetical protein
MTRIQILEAAVALCTKFAANWKNKYHPTAAASDAGDLRSELLSLGFEDVNVAPRVGAAPRWLVLNHDLGAYAQITLDAAGGDGPMTGWAHVESVETVRARIREAEAAEQRKATREDNRMVRDAQAERDAARADAAMSSCNFAARNCAFTASNSARAASACATTR